MVSGQRLQSLIVRNVGVMIGVGMSVKWRLVACV